MQNQKPPRFRTQKVFSLLAVLLVDEPPFIVIRVDGLHVLCVGPTTPVCLDCCDSGLPASGDGRHVVSHEFHSVQSHTVH